MTAPDPSYVAWLVQAWHARVCPCEIRGTSTEADLARLSTLVHGDTIVDAMDATRRWLDRMAAKPEPRPFVTHKQSVAYFFGCVRKMTGRRLWPSYVPVAATTTAIVPPPEPEPTGPSRTTPTGRRLRLV